MTLPAPFVPTDQQTDPSVCPHPANRLFAWVVRDDTQPGLTDRTVVRCCLCGTVLHDAAQPKETRRHE